MMMIVTALLLWGASLPLAAQTPTETPSPAPTGTAGNLVVQVTPTPSLQEQMNQLAAQVEASDNANLLVLLINKLFDWPIFVLVLVIAFRAPFVRFLDRIANSAHSVRFGDISVELSDVELLLVEREILRFGIMLADADGDFSKDESSVVLGIARDMPEYMHLLTERGKYEVLKKALNIAAADQEIRKTEYDHIMKFATKFDMSRDDIDQKIVAICREDNIAPPPQLAAYFPTNEND